MRAMVMVMIFTFIPALIVLIDATYFGIIKGLIGGDDQQYRSDLNKTLLQFFLVTFAGGIITYLMNTMKSSRDDLNEMRNDLITAYRQIKRIRRMMRPHVDKAPEDGWKIDSAVFLDAITKIQDSQLELEMLRDRLLKRSDIVSPLKARKLAKLIRYAHEYLHDVFEEYEKRRALPKDGLVTLGQNCPLLRDFIASRGWPPVSEEIRKELNLEKIDDGDQRVVIMIDESRKTSENQNDKVRYSTVATKALRMAIKIL